MSSHSISAYWILIELEYGTQDREFELFDPKRYGVNIYEWENKRIDCLIQALAPDLYESEQKMKENEKPDIGVVRRWRGGEARFSGNVIKDYIIPSKWYKEYETLHDKHFSFEKYKNQKIYALETVFGTIILGDNDKFLPFCDYDEIWLYSYRYDLLAWQELDKEEKTWIFQPEFKVNKYLCLKLEEYGKTHIYINNEEFITCLGLELNIPINKVRYDKEILYQNGVITYEITPKELFQAFCSNFQVWYEHDYDTRLFDCAIAFSLLEKLTEAGDPLAKKQFKKEIMLRIESGYEPVIKYLLKGGYSEFFDEKEKEIIMESLGRNFQFKEK